jgi:hypothetical protein
MTNPLMVTLILFTYLINSNKIKYSKYFSVKLYDLGDVDGVRMVELLVPNQVINSFIK